MLPQSLFSLGDGQKQLGTPPTLLNHRRLLPHADHSVSYQGISIEQNSAKGAAKGSNLFPQPQRYAKRV